MAYDPENDFLPMILAHCDYSLKVGEGTTVEFNWKCLERQLVDRFIRGRPRLISLVNTNSELELEFRSGVYKIHWKIIDLDKNKSLTVKMGLYREGYIRFLMGLYRGGYIRRGLIHGRFLC